ncbi:MAG: GNAT family N-acetyltransferase [Chloroflexota bacterium]
MEAKGEFLKITPGNLVKIVPATWRDVFELQDLEKACFSLDAWPLLDLMCVLIMPKVVRWKAVIGERMVGFIAADIRRRQDCSWIATFGVLPEYQQRGIGTALLQACEAQVQTSRICLSVRRSNRAALALYRKFGYREVGEWPRYYRGAEDALVLERILPQSMA